MHSATLKMVVLMLLPHDIQETYLVYNKVAVGNCHPPSEESDGNYPLVLGRNRTLLFHTITVAPSDVKVIISQVLNFLFIYLPIYLFVFFKYAFCTKELSVCSCEDH